MGEIPSPRNELVTALKNSNMEFVRVKMKCFRRNQKLSIKLGKGVDMYAIVQITWGPPLILVTSELKILLQRAVHCGQGQFGYSNHVPVIGCLVGCHGNIGCLVGCHGNIGWLVSISVCKRRCLRQAWSKMSEDCWRPQRSKMGDGWRERG